MPALIFRRFSLKYPFIKVGHRNGNVFVRIVDKKANIGCKLSPLEAISIATEIRAAALQSSKGLAKIHFESPDSVSWDQNVMAHQMHLKIVGESIADEGLRRKDKMTLRIPSRLTRVELDELNEMRVHPSIMAKILRLNRLFPQLIKTCKDLLEANYVDGSEMDTAIQARALLEKCH